MGNCTSHGVLQPDLSKECDDSEGSFDLETNSSFECNEIEEDSFSLSRVQLEGNVLLVKLCEKNFQQYYRLWVGSYLGQTVWVKKIAESDEKQVPAALSDHSQLNKQVPAPINRKKKHRRKRNMDDVRLLITEIQLLSQLQHPHIIPFIGATWSNLQDLSLVMEFMENGSLRDFLDKHENITWKTKKLEIAISIAEALFYLHHTCDPCVLHQDLKSDNILFDKDWNVKLAHFSISLCDDRNCIPTSGVDSIRWKAPEVLMGQEGTAASDVFSFGIILSELDTQQIPYSHLPIVHETGISMGIVTGNIFPEFGKNCPPLLLTLANACLRFDPEQRPSAKAILEELKSNVFNQVANSS